MAWPGTKYHMCTALYESPFSTRVMASASLCHMDALDTLISDTGAGFQATVSFLGTHEPYQHPPTLVPSATSSVLQKTEPSYQVEYSDNYQLHVKGGSMNLPPMTQSEEEVLRTPSAVPHLCRW